jgi:hypothetical protein
MNRQALFHTGKWIALLPFIVLVLGVTGCSSNNKGKIEGTKWSSNPTTVKGQPIPAGALRLEFTTDGKLTYVAGPMTFTGTYSLGGGDTVTFHLTQDLAGRKTHAEKISISGTTLTMTDSDGTSLSFSQVK